MALPFAPDALYVLFALPNNPHYAAILFVWNESC